MPLWNRLHSRKAPERGVGASKENSSEHDAEAVVAPGQQLSDSVEQRPLYDSFHEQEQEPGVSPPRGAPSPDVVGELQRQLQAAVERCNALEGKIDRALKESRDAKQQRDHMEAVADEAALKLQQKEKELKGREDELERLSLELQDEKKKRMAAQLEVEERQQQVELLKWKLQEAEQNATGLRALAAQAEGAVELARAETAAVELRASETVQRVEAAAAGVRERVVWLEEELAAMKERVALSEFRLREEGVRAEALVAEADELAVKLRVAEERIERLREAGGSSHGVVTQVKGGGEGGGRQNGAALLRVTAMDASEESEGGAGPAMRVFCPSEAGFEEPSAPGVTGEGAMLSGSWHPLSAGQGGQPSQAGSSELKDASSDVLAEGGDGQKGLGEEEDDDGTCSDEM